MSEQQNPAGEPRKDEARVATLEKQLEKAEKRIAEKDKTIARLTKELQVKEATKGNKMPTKLVDGEAYIAAFPFLDVKLPDGKRKRMTAEEIMNNEELLRSLIKKGSGFPRKVDLNKKK